MFTNSTEEGTGEKEIIQRLQLTGENMAELAFQLRGQPAEDLNLRDRVAEIIARVKEGGDKALAAYTREFDSPGFDAAYTKVAPAEIDAAMAATPPVLMESFKLAAENIRLFHQHELRGDWTAPMRQSQMLGQRIIPVDRAGLYVPGGGGDYPSTVLMTAVPAQVAGVKDIFICTPPSSEGEISQAVLAAAGLLEINEVYRAGGAQAIAAMAYGTETIGPADVICGPGNIYVTEAKRQVYGRVGLDSLAGPSEVLIIADDAATPDLIAADLLAQVEHGSGAIAVLVSTSEVLLDDVEQATKKHGQELGLDAGLLDRISLVRAAGSDDDLGLAIAFSNCFAPEHLQIHTIAPEQVVHEITCAGAVFLGEDVCTAYGDYIVGSNHVLPTAGTARFSSALSVENFQRKVAVISLIPATVTELTPSLVEMARVEGMRAHARAAELRQAKFGAKPDDDGK